MPLSCLMPGTADSQVSNQSMWGTFLWRRPCPSFAWLHLGSAGATNCLKSGWDTQLFLAHMICSLALTKEPLLLARVIPPASAPARLTGTSVCGLFRIEPRMAPSQGTQYRVGLRAPSAFYVTSTLLSAPLSLYWAVEIGVVSWRYLLSHGIPVSYPTYPCIICSFQLVLWLCCYSWKGTLFSVLEENSVSSMRSLIKRR